MNKFIVILSVFLVVLANAQTPVADLDLIVDGLFLNTNLFSKIFRCLRTSWITRSHIQCKSMC